MNACVEGAARLLFCTTEFFLLFLFRNFLVSRFVAEHTLILAQVAQSGAERDQQLVFSFLLFSAIFCSFRPFLHTCPAMPCHLRLSSNLLFCALDNRNFKMKQKNIKEMKRKSCGPTIFNLWRGLASHGPFVKYSKNPSAKRKGLNFSCSAVKRQMTANKRV